MGKEINFDRYCAAIMIDESKKTALSEKQLGSHVTWSSVGLSCGWMPPVKNPDSVTAVEMQRAESFNVAMKNKGLI